MLEALEKAVRERWPVEAELLAVNAEVSHLAYRAGVTIQKDANAKPARMAVAELPPPLRVPRPWDEKAPDVKPVRRNDANAIKRFFGKRRGR